MSADTVLSLTRQGLARGLDRQEPCGAFKQYTCKSVAGLWLEGLIPQRSCTSAGNPNGQSSVLSL